MKLTGVIKKPRDLTNKHKKQSSWKVVLILDVDDDTASYYAWFLKSRFNLNLNQSIRGTHVTIVNDRSMDSSLDRHELRTRIESLIGEEVEIEFDVSPRSNGVHWWLRVNSDELHDIREYLGFDRTPFYNFHLSIGHADGAVREAHSEYILNTCKFYDI